MRKKRAFCLAEVARRDKFLCWPENSKRRVNLPGKESRGGYELDRLALNFSLFFATAFALVLMRGSLSEM